VTDTEKVPVNEIKGFAGQLIGMFILAGIIIVLCLVAGLGFGGIRIFRRKILKRDDPDAMTVLNIRYGGPPDEQTGASGQKPSAQGQPK
jgi:hypothetical protein